MRNGVLKRLFFTLIFCLFATTAYCAEQEITAELTIDNKVVFSFGENFDKTVDIYGTDSTSTEGELLISGVNTSKGSFSYDFIADGTTYYDYYIIKPIDETASYTVKTEYLLPRVSKEITNLEHPFVAATKADIERTKKLIETDDYYKASFKLFKNTADNYVETYLKLESTYPRGDSKNAGLRAAASHCAVMWNLTGEQKYFEVARHILLLVTEHLQNDNALGTETKNDYTFTQEFVNAYDLIYNGLNEVDRQIIENGCLRRWADIFWSLSRGHMSNLAGGNDVPLAVGLVLKDQELVERALNRENYGIKFLLLNEINDDGTRWNYPSGYIMSRTVSYFGYADMLYRSGYDMFNYKVSGTRPTEWWASSANYRIVDDGDISVVEGRNALKESLEGILNYAYPNYELTALGDAVTDVYKLNASHMLKIAEIACRYYDDTRINYILSSVYGQSLGENEPQPESQRRQNGSFTDPLQMLIAKPLLKGGSLDIGSGKFGERGYNKLGNSVFNDRGQVFFRSPGTMDSSVNTSVYWQNYFEPGHGHNDTLNLTMYGAGREILFDPGKYDYGTLIQSDYAVETVGHNVMMIDEESYQEPDYTDTPEWVRKGFKDTLAISPFAKAVKTYSDRLYREGGEIGTLTRSVWQIDNYAIDVYSAQMEGKHQFDYLLNIDADNLNESSLSMSDKSGDEALSPTGGFAYIRPYKTGATDTIWSNTYGMNNGGSFRLTMLGGEKTEVFASKSPTKDEDYTFEKLVARRNGEDKTTFISILEPVAYGEELRNIEEIPVMLKGKEIDWASAAKITGKDTNNEDIFMYGYSYGVKEADVLTSDGDTAFLRRENEKDTILGGIGMKYISGETLGMKFNTITSAFLTKLGDEIWRLDIGEGKGQLDGNAILYGMPKGLKVYEAELSDDYILREVSMNGYMSFKVEKNSIYIIAENIEKAKSVPQMKFTFVPDEIKVYDYTRVLDIVDFEGTTLDSLPEGIIVEAEDFTSTVGGSSIRYILYEGDSHSTNNEEGSAFYGWDAEGYNITWKFNVPEAGKYKAAIRYSTLDTAKRAFSINGEEPYILNFEVTEGWSVREVAMLKNEDGSDHIFELNEGENTLIMENLGSALNLDCFSFVKVE